MRSNTEQMCFRVTKTSGRKISPDPRFTSARHKEATRHSPPPEGRPEPDGAAAARDHRVPSSRGDAEQPGAQPVGQRVLRRLEAALAILPGWTDGWEGSRNGGEDAPVLLRPPRCRSRHTETGDPSQARPRSADRPQALLAANLSYFIFATGLAGAVHQRGISDDGRASFAVGIDVMELRLPPDDLVAERQRAFKVSERQGWTG